MILKKKSSILILLGDRDLDKNPLENLVESDNEQRKQEEALELSGPP